MCIGNFVPVNDCINEAEEMLKFGGGLKAVIAVEEQAVVVEFRVDVVGIVQLQ